MAENRGKGLVLAVARLLASPHTTVLGCLNRPDGTAVWTVKRFQTIYELCGNGMSKSLDRTVPILFARTS